MSTVTNGTTISSSVLDAINGSSSSKKTTSTSGTSSDTTSADGIQDRFLTLLVTQLKNQDPLNPMDNAQMTSQLAQISTVTGLSNLNTTVQSLLDSNTNTQALQAANLIGQSVLAKGDNINLSSGSGTAAIDLSGSADAVTVTIKNASGATVQTIDLGSQSSGIKTFTWDGTTTSGSTATDGSYTFSVAASQSGTTVSTTALNLATVSSVARSSSGVSVNLGARGNVSLSDIHQIF